MWIQIFPFWQCPQLISLVCVVYRDWLQYQHRVKGHITQLTSGCWPCMVKTCTKWHITRDQCWSLLFTLINSNILDLHFDLSSCRPVVFLVPHREIKILVHPDPEMESNSFTVQQCFVVTLQRRIQFGIRLVSAYCASCGVSLLAVLMRHGDPTWHLLWLERFSLPFCIYWREVMRKLTWKCAEVTRPFCHGWCVTSQSVCRFENGICRTYRCTAII